MAAAAGPLSLGLIDGHHHLWDLSAVDYPWLAERRPRFFGDPAPIARRHDLADFRESHGGQRVRASVHVQVGAADPLAETRWLAAQAEAHGWPLAIVAEADLTAPDLGDRLDWLAEAAGGRLRGVRQIVARHPAEDGAAPGGLLRDPAFARGLERLGDRGFSFDLQLTAPLLPEAARLFGTMRGLAVALCHAGSPWDAGSEAMARWRDGLARFAAEVPGSVVKLSGLGMLRRTGDGVSAIAAGVRAAFGPERTLWGSNWPVDALHRAGWAAILAEAWALVPDAERAAVFASTARAFYRP
ncbi:MAG: amidohydrolase family protein [Sphingomonadaceae bacterium]